MPSSAIWRNAALALTGLGRSLAELCFPSVCLLCRQGLPAFSAVQLCPDCRARVQVIRAPICLCCGVEFSCSGASHLCGSCLRKPPHFSRARAIFRYDQESAPLVHAFKYGGKTQGRATFRALAGEVALLADLAPPELIVPVPLHPTRLRERGFNQALVLARFLFPEQRGLIAPDLLLRTRVTHPQVSLSGRERRQNLGGAFAVSQPGRVPGRRVLLVDDVFTTGTTLNECAKVLVAAGAAGVEALTLARVQ
jgi:ComF family protein